MKTLLKGAKVLNVFTDQLEDVNLLIEDKRIAGVGDYTDSDADVVEDVSGKILVPGLIDGHMHIESSHLQPAEFARAVLPHGTTTIVADPHEIVNVSGLIGMTYMLEASENIPETVFFMAPSCVPATSFDEAGSRFDAEDIKKFYNSERVLGLAEMMNYPGVVNRDPMVMRKIDDAREMGLIINGHAPLLSGKDLDKYIASGVQDDHECSSPEEAKERIRKGQWLMIRNGTAARNLQALLPLFEEPYNRRCLLVTDDIHPYDILKNGHIDAIIREAVKAGKSPLVAIRMASIQAAQCFGMRFIGALTPGYEADIIVLDDLESFKIRDVYQDGKKVVENGVTLPFQAPQVHPEIMKAIRNSIYIKKVQESRFHIEPEGKKVRVIKVLKGELLTDSFETELDFNKNNGIDLDRDILKFAVFERHSGTGHMGIGFINGLCLKSGAIGTSVAHDSHNILVVGTNDADMALAVNHVRKMCGGYVVVRDGKILAEMPMPLGGLLSVKTAEEVAQENVDLVRTVRELGVPADIKPFMTLSFMCLTVIPHLKLTTLGLVDVDKQELVPLFVD